MMMGNGMPSSHNKIPLPTKSLLFFHNYKDLGANELGAKRFRLWIGMGEVRPASVITRT